MDLVVGKHVRIGRYHSIACCYCCHSSRLLSYSSELSVFEQSWMEAAGTRQDDSLIEHCYCCYSIRSVVDDDVDALTTTQYSIMRTMNLNQSCQLLDRSLQMLNSRRVVKLQD